MDSAQAWRGARAREVGVLEVEAGLEEAFECPRRVQHRLCLFLGRPAHGLAKASATGAMARPGARAPGLAPQGRNSPPRRPGRPRRPIASLPPLRQVPQCL